MAWCNNASQITQELTESVRRAAWMIYQDRERRGLPGTDKGDWLEAERRIRPFKPYIELAAYEEYLARTREGIPGDKLSDWLEAEAYSALQENPLLRFGIYLERE